MAGVHDANLTQSWASVAQPPPIHYPTRLPTNLGPTARSLDMVGHGKPYEAAVGMPCWVNGLKIGPRERWDTLSLCWAKEVAAVQT